MYTITCGANQTLYSAGMSTLLWISGLMIFIHTKTVASTVLKVNIHLYRQRAYTIRPAVGRKRLYHSRVSPMVRNGGRSSDTQSPTIKLKKTTSPRIVMMNGQRLFCRLCLCAVRSSPSSESLPPSIPVGAIPLQAKYAPAAQSKTAMMAKIQKLLHVTITRTLSLRIHE